ncbi:MAG: hypothetical protein R3F54_10150 [Alphaproteobacteria bacterium]
MAGSAMPLLLRWSNLTNDQQEPATLYPNVPFYVDVVEQMGSYAEPEIASCDRLVHYSSLLDKPGVFRFNVQVSGADTSPANILLYLKTTKDEDNTTIEGAWVDDGKHEAASNHHPALGVFAT